MTTTARPQGATVWLTGLPSAGRTTIAGLLRDRLRADGRRAEVLDGDEIRRFLTAGLGFSRADRCANVRRVGLAAEVPARNGVVCVVPVIAPYADSREAVRARHAASGTPYFEVYVATPPAVCAARDVKGLYARQAAGMLTGLTGGDDPYEPPADPELVLRTEAQTPWESADAVHSMLVEHGPARRAGLVTSGVSLRG